MIFLIGNINVEFLSIEKIVIGMYLCRKHSYRWQFLQKIFVCEQVSLVIEKVFLENCYYINSFQPNKVLSKYCLYKPLLALFDLLLKKSLPTLRHLLSSFKMYALIHLLTLPGRLSGHSPVRHNP